MLLILVPAQTGMLPAHLLSLALSLLQSGLDVPHEVLEDPIGVKNLFYGGTSTYTHMLALKVLVLVLSYSEPEFLVLQGACTLVKGRLISEGRFIFA